MTAVATKSDLVSALGAFVADPQRREANRFLRGLSTDELRYIAEFLGCCILESQTRSSCDRAQLAEGIKQFEAARYCSRRRSTQADQEHKMILLLEYLCRTGLTQFSLTII